MKERITPQQPWEHLVDAPALLRLSHKLNHCGDGIARAEPVHGILQGDRTIRRGPGGQLPARIEQNPGCARKHEVTDRAQVGQGDGIAGPPRQHGVEQAQGRQADDGQGGCGKAGHHEIGIDAAQKLQEAQDR